MIDTDIESSIVSRGLCGGCVDGDGDGGAGVLVGMGLIGGRGIGIRPGNKSVKPGGNISRAVD